jgi:branched-chain amino acid transport system substrate-binding protein
VAQTRLIRTGAALLAGGLALSACSNSASGGTSGGGGSDDDAIQIGMFATTSAAVPSAFVNTWSVDGVQAAVEAINDDGGIDGRQLELAVCDNGGDPNKGATCARQAVQDEWVAVVGGFDPVASNQTLPILEAADVPYVGMLQVNPTEYQSPVSFPVSIGTVGGSVGTFAQMVEDGCTKPVMVGTTDPGADATAQQAQAVFGAADGVDFAGTLPFTTGTPDVNPVVADILASEPDCLTMIGSPGDAAKIFGAVREAAGEAINLYAPPGVLVPQILQALGPVAEGIKGASSSPLASSSDESIQQFLADLSAYSDDPVPNEFALNGYAAVQLLRQALEGLEDVSAASLLDQLSGMSDVQVMNYPPLDFTQSRDSELYPRVPNTSVWFAQVTNGAWVNVDAGESVTDVEKYLP